MFRLFFQNSLNKIGTVNVIPLITVLILTEFIGNAFFFFLNKYNFGYHPGLPSPKMALLPWCLSQTAMFPLVRPPRWARMTLTAWPGCTSAVSIRVNDSFLDCNMKMDCCWTWHVRIHPVVSRMNSTTCAILFWNTQKVHRIYLLSSVQRISWFLHYHQNNRWVTMLVILFLQQKRSSWKIDLWWLYLLTYDFIL